MSFRSFSLAGLCLIGCMAGLSPQLEAQVVTPGSLMLFPDVSASPHSVSLVSVTNTNSTEAVLTKWHYVNGADCTSLDRNRLLLPGDTLTVLASADAPHHSTGYLFVVALDPLSEEPIAFNWLIGESTITDGFSGFDCVIQPFAFEGIGDGIITDINGNGQLDLDGLEYSEVADHFLVPRFFGQDPVGGMRESELVLIDLTGGPGFSTVASVLAAKDNKTLFSVETTFSCWTKRRLLDVSDAFSSKFLTSRGGGLNGVLGSRSLEVGSMSIGGVVATGPGSVTVADPAVLGFLIERLGVRRSAKLPFMVGVQSNGQLPFGGALGCEPDGMLSVSADIPLMTANWQDSITIPRFDPNLGDLQSVEFELTANIQGMGSAESLDANPSTVILDFSASMALLRPDNSLLLAVSPSVQTVDNVTSYDGVLDFGGTSGFSYPNLTASQSETASSPPPASDLSLFTGLAGNPGTITLPIVAQGTSSTSGPGNLVTQFSLMAGAEVTVTYHYGLDCNGNGVPDNCDIASGTPDCNNNGIPDECEIPPDCNNNGIPDDCEVPPDCNQNGIPDDCEVPPDCNQNGIPDDCEVPPDCNQNGIPDDCELDGNMNGIPDDCEGPTCPTGVTFELWPPNHRYVEIDLEAVAGVDAAGNPLAVVITGITQDEPINANGDGNTVCDATGIGTSVAHVRSERQGGSNGRVYVISYEATDTFGASCSGSVQVTVPHSQNGDPAIDDGQTQDSTEGC